MPCQLRPSSWSFFLLFWLLLLLLLSNVPRARTADVPASCRPPARGPGRLSSKGTVKASLIFVDFPDAQANESVQDALKVASPTALSAFLNQSSFGQLDLQVTTHADKYYRMAQASTDYRYGIPLTAAAHEAYVSDALAAVGTNVTFAGTDLLLVATARTAAGSIAFTSAGFFSPVAGDGTTIPNVITLGGDWLANATSPTSALLQMAYSMGMRPQCPPATGDGEGDPYLGGFSPACDATPLAPDFLGRQKWTFGWLNGSEASDEVVCMGNSSQSSSFNFTLTLSAIEAASFPAESVGDNSNLPRSVARLAIVPLTDSLSLYAEARTQTGVDHDACLSGFGQGGVLLYSANAAAAASAGVTDLDLVYLVNPEVMDAYPSGCGSSRSGFLALLGLNDLNQKRNFTVTNTGVRVTVLAESGEHDMFSVRFESGVSEHDSTPTTSASSSSAGPPQPTKSSTGAKQVGWNGLFLALTMCLAVGFAT